LGGVVFNIISVTKVHSTASGTSPKYMHNTVYNVDTAIFLFKKFLAEAKQVLDKGLCTKVLPRL
jgi:hypothetical protein